MWKSSAFVLLVVFWNTFPVSVTSEDGSTEAPAEDNGFTSCKDSNQCNLSEGFICKKNLCKCAYKELTFDPETKRCKASVDGKCGFFIGSPNATMAHCPENSMCVWDNDAFKTTYQYAEKRCVCVVGHYKDASGTCVPFAKFDEPCTDKRRCDAESDLVCSAGSCQCPFGTDQYYDTELRKCISFVGGNCTMYCVDNAFCENYTPDQSINPKSWNMPDSSKREYSQETICQCRPGYEPSSDRRCKLIPPGFNSPCYGEGEQCDTKRNLQCIDKVCQCKNPLHQSYSYELGRCIGSVGDICDPDVKENCVLNAECSLDSASGNHVCQCSEGYSTTPARKCMKGFGQECYNEFCNVFSGLSCKNKTCQCYDSFLKYDETMQSCVSTIGGPCGKVYMPLELEEYAVNNAGLRHQFLTNTFRNQYMNMKALCQECDGYHISCPSGSVCASDTDILMVVRGKEKRKCRVPAT